MARLTGGAGGGTADRQERDRRDRLREFISPGEGSRTGESQQGGRGGGSSGPSDGGPVPTGESPFRTGPGPSDGGQDAPRGPPTGRPGGTPDKGPPDRRPSPPTGTGRGGPFNLRDNLSQPGRDVVGQFESMFRFEESDAPVTDFLTQSGGFLSEEEEAGFRESGRQAREQFDVSDEIREIIPGEFDPVEGTIAGLGHIPGDFAGLVSGSGVALAETGIEAAQNIPGAVNQFGAGETGKAITSVFGQAGTGFGEQAQERPFEFIGQAAGEIALGFGVGKAIETVPGLARSASIRARGGEIHKFEDLSDPPRETGGGLPGFTEGAMRDPVRAQSEFVEQASKNPLGGDAPTAFHGRAAEDVKDFGGFGPEFEAPAGSSELPGLFQSGDLSGLRLPGTTGASGPSIPKPRLPRPRLTTARVAAETDVDVDVMPPSVRTFGEGARFLEEADPGRSFIRSESLITGEQEAIAPPGSLFKGEELFGVKVGGDVIPGRTFTRAEPDAPGAGTGPFGDFLDAGDFNRRARESSRAFDDISDAARRAESDPFLPTLTPGGTSPSGPAIPGSDVFSDPTIETIPGSGSPGTPAPSGSSSGPPTIPGLTPSTPPGSSGPGSGGGSSSGGSPSIPGSDGRFIPGTGSGGSGGGDSTAPPLITDPPFSGPTSPPPPPPPPPGPTSPPPPPPPSSSGVTPPPPSPPPTTLVGIPGLPPSGPTPFPREFSQPQQDEPEREEEETSPFGETFQNPLLTAGEALANPFGGFGAIPGAEQGGTGGGKQETAPLGFPL